MKPTGMVREGLPLPLNDPPPKERVMVTVPKGRGGITHRREMLGLKCCCCCCTAQAVTRMVLLRRRKNGPLLQAVRLLPLPLLTVMAKKAASPTGREVEEGELKVRVEEGKERLLQFNALVLGSGEGVSAEEEKEEEV